MNVLFKTKPDLPRAFLQFEVGNIFLLNYYTSAYISILFDIFHWLPENHCKQTDSLQRGVSVWWTDTHIPYS